MSSKQNCFPIRAQNLTTNGISIPFNTVGRYSKIYSCSLFEIRHEFLLIHDGILLAHHYNNNLCALGSLAVRRLGNYVIAVFCIPTLIFAQTFDGRTPAEEQDCDSLNGAAFGLCVAYCEAQDCDININQPSCPQLKANFEKKTGSSILPCDARCGDGIVNDPSEQCDDGNAIPCDGCSNDCTLENIGDPNCNGTISECIPETCQSFSSCNLGGTCAFQGVCGKVYDGTGKCIDGATDCNTLLPCNPDGSCDELGATCFIESCCQQPVCVPADKLCNGGIEHIIEG